MLKKLRIRLTALYTLASIILALVVGFGTYALVNYYFQTNNDQELRVKMGLQFAALGLPLPTELYDSVRQAGLVISNPQTAGGSLQAEHEEGIQENELADIYVLPLTENGMFVNNTSSTVTLSNIDQDAVRAAIANGSDYRTIQTAERHSVRILTYLVAGSEEVQVLQVGRYLSSQQGLMRRLLNTMVLLGGLVTLFFGMASWFLAGRTIKPSQQAWDKQQVFVANASHELRTPLTLIHSGVELSLRKNNDLEVKEILTDVLSDANYMNKLIEDLLLLSRLDSKNLKFEIQPLSLEEFVPEIIRQSERLASQKEISIHSVVTASHLLADPIRLKQVLLIILDNAIRNNLPGGSIQFETFMENGHCVICISDTGKGIPSHSLDKVYDRFFKVNNQASADYRGSGLGLSIAKSLIEGQNGTIQITSLSGKGTQVKLLFPNAFMHTNHYV